MSINFKQSSIEENFINFHVSFRGGTLSSKNVVELNPLFSIKTILIKFLKNQTLKKEAF